MKKSIRLLLADSTYEAGDSMKRSLMKEGNIEVVGRAEKGDQVVEMSNELNPDVILLNLEIEGIDAVEAAKMLLNENPRTIVIMVFTEKNKNHIKRAMTAGVRDYIVKPFTINSLIDTIVNLYEMENKRRGALKQDEDFQIKSGSQITPQIDSKVVTVFSTKGGVGKSILAINIAVSLAEKTGKNVALIDLDLSSGDVAIMLDLYPKRTISELIKDLPSLDSEIMDEYLVRHSSGISVLPAPVTPEQAEYITPVNIEKIVKVLINRYHYIVIDTGPSFRDINLAALDMSDRILFVTTLDVATVKNARIGLDIMRKLNYEDNKISMVLNRYHKKFGISIKDLEKTAQKDISAIVPMDDRTVINSINTGEPFVVKQSKKPVSKRISQISDFIIKG
ncbi:pilus assembly protein CpaE [Peptoclostridium litorale DSM 5388]|uniref:Stage 0 sporulation protein A homolog n=1 Tax=Peptoclostridium litorale DSM 5388 TaxID=1121324 RepID=A0A069RHN4_PEPLI|nr:response regulator [Peptoclostridium litorale]KDR93777.1 response regulator receiver protein [Peptoclostridium litorale DSM 5388]SIN85659.1 pilus assembly protein CpaE [Peptoclostridium litorale DSM 5388]